MDLSGKCKAIHYNRSTLLQLRMHTRIHQERKRVPNDERRRDEGTATRRATG
jgi:hypothetical protein